MSSYVLIPCNEGENASAQAYFARVPARDGVPAAKGPHDRRAVHALRRQLRAQLSCGVYAGLFRGRPVPDRTKRSAIARTWFPKKRTHRRSCVFGLKRLVES